MAKLPKNPDGMALAREQLDQIVAGEVLLQGLHLEGLALALQQVLGVDQDGRQPAQLSHVSGFLLLVVQWLDLGQDQCLRLDEGAAGVARFPPFQNPGPGMV